MSAFWDDVDDKQMTHSGEPTTEKERELLTAFCKDLISRTAGHDEPEGITLRLIADVERLEAEVAHLEAWIVKMGGGAMAHD